MPRSQRRRSSRRGVGERQITARQTQLVLLIGCFVIGAGLEWVRSQPTTANWTWWRDLLTILLATWASVALLRWWPGGTSTKLPGAAALALLALYVGTLAMHALLYHG